MDEFEDSCLSSLNLLSIDESRQFDGRLSGSFAAAPPPPPPPPQIDTSTSGDDNTQHNNDDDDDTLETFSVTSRLTYGSIQTLPSTAAKESRKLKFKEKIRKFQNEADAKISFRWKHIPTFSLNQTAISFPSSRKKKRRHVMMDLPPRAAYAHKLPATACHAQSIIIVDNLNGDLQFVPQDDICSCDRNRLGKWWNKVKTASPCHSKTEMTVEQYLKHQQGLLQMISASQRKLEQTMNDDYSQKGGVVVDDNQSTAAMSIATVSENDDVAFVMAITIGDMNAAQKKRYDPDLDVLSGPYVEANHRGNARFQSICKSKYQPHYQQLAAAAADESESEKQQIVKQLVEEVHCYGGRFLQRREPGCSVWISMSRIETLNMVTAELENQQSRASLVSWRTSCNSLMPTVDSAVFDDVDEDDDLLMNPGVVGNQGQQSNGLNRELSAGGAIMDIEKPLGPPSTAPPLDSSQNSQQQSLVVCQSVAPPENINLEPTPLAPPTTAAAAPPVVAPSPNSQQQFQQPVIYNSTLDVLLSASSSSSGQLVASSDAGAGNQKFISLCLNEHRRARRYNQAALDPDTKHQIALEVVEQIQSGGGRFVVQQQPQGVFLQVSLWDALRMVVGTLSQEAGMGQQQQDQFATKNDVNIGSSFNSVVDMGANYSPQVQQQPGLPPEGGGNPGMLPENWTMFRAGSGSNLRMTSTGSNSSGATIPTAHSTMLDPATMDPLQQLSGSGSHVRMASAGSNSSSGATIPTAHSAMRDPPLGGCPLQQHLFHHRTTMAAGVNNVIPPVISGCPNIMNCLPTRDPQAQQLQQQRAVYELNQQQHAITSNCMDSSFSDSLAPVPIPEIAASQSATAAEAASNSGAYNSADVLSGRGSGPNDHPGNVFYVNLCEDVYQALYQSAPSQDEKNRLIQEVIDKIEARGGRFLKKNLMGSWVPLPEKERREKVAKKLRKKIDTTNKASVDEHQERYKARQVFIQQLQDNADGAARPRRWRKRNSS